MIDTSSYLFLASELLFLASGIFLAHIIMEVKKGDRLSGNFGLWMMVFMLAWSVSEVIEDALALPAGDPLHYLHFVVMSSFAVVVTLRWRWASSQVRKRNEESSGSPSVPKRD